MYSLIGSREGVYLNIYINPNAASTKKRAVIGLLGWCGFFNNAKETVINIK